MSRLAVVAALAYAVSAACAQAEKVPLLEGLEQRSGLVLLIASSVIIILMVLMLFYLHSINDHLNWIRRIR